MIRSREEQCEKHEGEGSQQLPYTRVREVAGPQPSLEGPMDVGGLVGMDVFSSEPEFVIDGSQEGAEVVCSGANLVVGVGAARVRLGLPPGYLVASNIYLFCGVEGDVGLYICNYLVICFFAELGAGVARDEKHHDFGVTGGHVELSVAGGGVKGIDQVDHPGAGCVFPEGVVESHDDFVEDTHPYAADCSFVGTRQLRDEGYVVILEASQRDRVDDLVGVVDLVISGDLDD